MASWWEFYPTPPRRAIALDEFHDAGLQRLRVLRAALSFTYVEQRAGSLEELPEPARSTYRLMEQDDEFDCIGHYALRLAFCSTRDRMDWLVDAESKLLELRLKAMPPLRTIELLRQHGYSFITKSSAQQGSGSMLQVELYQVPFQQVSKLVARRLVTLDRGSCWVPTSYMYHVATYHFKVPLRQQLLVMQRTLPLKRAEIDRLAPIFDELYRECMLLDQHPLNAASRRGEEGPMVTPDTVDALAEKHFPPCMQHLHRKFRQNHHLKFDGRVQYRVFLKGLGFSVHDSIQFFRSEFTKVIPPAKFDREYVYHIRHSYGLEGSRKDYAPMDCDKIIHGGAPRHGQYHGCPFKHWDSVTLQTELRRSSVSHSTLETIGRFVTEGRHQEACVAYFDGTHQTPYRLGESGAQMHPNDWVRASWGQRR